MTPESYYKELLEYRNKKQSVPEKYYRMRSLLEQLCIDPEHGKGPAFSTFFARLSYTCNKHKLSPLLTRQLQQLRIHASQAIKGTYIPSKSETENDIQALAQAIYHLAGGTIPQSLQETKHDDIRESQYKKEKKTERIRILVSSVDDEFIYGYDEALPSEKPVKVKYNIPSINIEFNESVKQIWPGCQINLIDVYFSEDNIYIPEIIITEPDYLLDISSLAECHKDYGNHPLNYILGLFMPKPNSSAIILGNFANQVLDTLLYAKKEEDISLYDIFTNTFHQYPLEFSTCKDLKYRDKESKFKDELRRQYHNIREIVFKTFQDPAYKIDRSKTIIEPAFICEKLGIQGRMDFLQDDYRCLIELKSGKANDFLGSIHSKENHYIQMLLYLEVLHYTLNIRPNQVKSYLLYSRYPLLFREKEAHNYLKKVLDIRNRIVSYLYRIGSEEKQAAQILNMICPETLNTRHLVSHYWDLYLKAPISAFRENINKLSELEKNYFISLLSFTAREHYLSKLQIREMDKNRDGSYWLDFEHKKENGDILYNLSVIEKSGSTGEPPSIRLSIPVYESIVLPNFRNGDSVILYLRENENDNVTNRQIFKGFIESISNKSVTVRLRYKQENPKILPQNGLYAIEHDSPDTSFNTIYRGLYTFCTANQDRKDLLLNQRSPAFTKNRHLSKDYGNKDLNRILEKSLQADDFFLLIGPPGSGKTSIALQSMVMELRSNTSCNILLLAYTNRAVDEICRAIEEITPKCEYIRIGSELSCEEAYRRHLIEKVIGRCSTREEVKECINSHHIFIGTITAISSRSELFGLLHFNVAIIDEASQILEPHLLPILCARNPDGNNAIEKFILIGDHKQLPAIVLQNPKESESKNPLLNDIGLYDRRNSLFERLYNIHKGTESPVWDMLRKQGRMHPVIADFPNKEFYNGLLSPVPTAHQRENILFNIYDNQNPLQRLLAVQRLIFIPSEEDLTDRTHKTNYSEARITTNILNTIYDLYRQNNQAFIPEKSVGIITPYRSQIALIRQEIEKLNIPELNNLTIDTVERYQGSQRDIIIYSFSVNKTYQIDMLSNILYEGEKAIDRKLNVALTRSRKQIIITGNPDILRYSPIYNRLLKYISEHGSYTPIPL